MLCLHQTALNSHLIVVVTTIVIVIVIWLMKNHISSQEFSKWSLLSQLKSIRRVLISYFLTRNTESSPGQLKSDVLLEMICRWESIQHWVGCLNADVTTLGPEPSTAMRRRGQCYWHFYTRNHHYLTRQDNRHLNSNKSDYHYTQGTRLRVVYFDLEKSSCIYTIHGRYVSDISHYRHYRR